MSSYGIAFLFELTVQMGKMFSGIRIFIVVFVLFAQDAVSNA